MNLRKKGCMLRSTERSDMKRQLQEAFDAPAPFHREEFLRSYPMQQISTFSLIVTQAGFIRKGIWIFSLCVFGLGLYKAHLLDPDTLWELSALAPFVAMTLLSENARSKAYGMADLEMSCRFFRKSILLARMGCLALSHFLLLCLLTPLAYICSDFTILQVGVYLLVPYLLTVVLGLWVTRKIPGRESLMACAFITAGVSSLGMLLKYRFSSLWTTGYWNGWFVTLLLLLLLSVLEVRKTVKQMEEARWNLL